MPTFQPSSYSRLARNNPDYLEVSDGTGKFSVRSNGFIEVLSGYPNVGERFTPGTTKYNAVVKALVSAGRNAELTSVLGAAKVAAALQAAPPTFIPPAVQQLLPSNALQGPMGGSGSAGDDAPFYKHPYFAPAAMVIGATGITILAIVFFWPQINNSPAPRPSTASKPRKR